MSGASTPTPEHVRCGTHGSLASHACWGQMSRWSAATDAPRRSRPGFGHQLRCVWQQHLPNPSHQHPAPAAPESQERREIGYAGRWQSPRIGVQADHPEHGDRERRPATCGTAGGGHLGLLPLPPLTPGAHEALFAPGIHATPGDIGMIQRQCRIDRRAARPATRAACRTGGWPDRGRNPPCVHSLLERRNRASKPERPARICGPEVRSVSPCGTEARIPGTGRQDGPVPAGAADQPVALQDGTPPCLRQ